MLRPLYRRVIVGIFALMPVLASAQSSPVTYVCSGILKSENIFEPGSAKNLTRHYTVTVNAEAGYIKRDQELAAGCMAKQIEICSCNLGQDLIHCRSMGLNRNGQEISADFKLQPQTGVMNFNARSFDPEAGKLIETQGTLSCSPQK